MSAYAVSSRGLAAHKVPQGVLATIMEMLYSNSEQGIAKLDFSGFAGMYQDRARTIPYTAVEQPLGSFTGLNGVTATAPADVNRGVVSARVNLLQSLDGGLTPVDLTWGSSPASVRYVEAPDGSLTAVVPVTDASTDRWQFGISANTFPNGTVLSYSYHKKYVAPTGVSGQVVGLNNLVGLGSGAYSETAAPNGFTRCTHLLTVTATGAQQLVRLYLPGVVGADDLAVWGHDLRLAIDAHLPYQRVNTGTDYDTAGFPHYLAFNGTNTAYVTPSIDFSGTDKMTVWAGVSRIANGGIPIELSTAVGSNAGSFYFFAGDRGSAAGARWTISSRGSAVDNENQAVETAANYNAPLTNVVTGAFDISGDSTILRINGGQIGSATGDQGTGNYGNYPLYIGARSGTHLYFNGRIYSLIVRGAESSISQIEAVETLIRQKMRLP